MTDEEKKLYEPYSYDIMNHIGWAIKALAEAMTERYRPGIPPKVSQAQKYLSEFFESITEIPKLSKEEAELSRNIHTYLRKYCDDYLTTTVYRFVAAGKGTSLWYDFIKSLVKYAGKQNQIKVAKRELEDVERLTDDDLVMLVLLTKWEDEEIKRALDDIKEWSKEC